MRDGEGSSVGRDVIVGTALVAVVWLLLSWTFMWMPVCWPEQSASRNACINNLRMIDGAKDQWAIEYRKSVGDEIDVDAVNMYLKGNRSPTCPDGGTYVYGYIGSDPVCTLDGEWIPERPARVRTSAFRWRWAPYEAAGHTHRSHL